MFDKPLSITPEEVTAYKQDGYLVIPDAFSDSECDVAVDMLMRHAVIAGNKDFAAVMNLDRPEEWKHIYGDSGNWVHVYVRQMLAKHPVLITALEELHGCLPGDLVLMQTMFLYKKAGTLYGFQAWNPHQDGAHHGAPYGTTLTGNIIFTDQDVENGCMFIYPGSQHINTFLESKKVKSFHEKPGSKPGYDVSESLPDSLKETKIDLPIKKGSLLVLHGGVIHGSYPNVSKDRDRPMYLAPYKTIGVPFSYGTDGKRIEIPIR